MKLKIGLIGVILLFFISLSLLCFPFFSVGQVSDISYTFEDNDFYHETNPSYDSQRNFSNKTIYTGHYNATYSFENEIDGTSGTDIDFVDSFNDPADTNVQIISGLGGHSKVLEIYDNTSVSRPSIINVFPATITIGIVEFWFRLTDNTKSSELRLQNGGNAVRIFLNDLIAVDDVLFHYKISFNTDTDLYDHWLNSILIASGVAFDLVSTGITQVNFITANADNDYYTYIDAIGYSWHPFYDIGDNLYPYYYLNNEIEIDKWEFFNNEDGSLAEHNQADIPFWDEKSTPVVSKSILPDSEDNTYVYCKSVSTTHVGIERDFQLSTSEVIIINFTVWHGNLISGSYDVYNDYNIYSYDDTLNVRLRSKLDHVASTWYLYYYNGSVYEFLLDLSGIGNNFISYHLYILNDIVQLNVSGVKSGLYNFPILNIDKEGLGEIEVENYLDGMAGMIVSGLMIDSIQVKLNNNSLSNDWGNFIYNSGIDFSTKEHNLLYLDAEGEFGLGIAQTGILSNDFTYFTPQNVSNISFNNYYDLSEITVNNAYLSLASQYSNHTINHIQITGIQVDDGTNEISATYNYGNIDGNLSYWYISGTDTLSYNLISNDTNTEYIEISFDIENVVTYQRTIIYTGSNFNLFGRELRLNYLDSTTSIINVSYAFRTERVYLVSNKQFISFSILITDNDIYSSYSATGYFTNFILRSSSGHDISITTSSLLTALTPLLFVILLPSFIITFSFKKTGKDDELRGKVLLPIVSAFSVVAFWFAEIELWMFFLMMIGFGILFYIQRD